jgi:hypothetical protein
LIILLFFLSVPVYSEEVPNTHQGVADAAAGDHLFRLDGTRIVLIQADIEYAWRILNTLNTVDKQEAAQVPENFITTKDIVNAVDNNIGKYKVGDTGPAGGIVFYDKGYFYHGWRYLEAAPAETEFTAMWGLFSISVTGLSAEIGSGRKNTLLIADRLKESGEKRRAAQICLNLKYGGYKDWFLPSRDELDLIYNNLVQNGLGDFKTIRDRENSTHVYWSSSQNKTIPIYQLFTTGEQVDWASGSSSKFSVRAVRAF